MRNHACVVFGLATVLVSVSCSSKSTTTSPSTSPAATITIAAGSGVDTKSVTVPRGSQVQFINNDSVSHQMASDPHPEHTDCPEINTVGFLVNGLTNARRDFAKLRVP